MKFPGVLKKKPVEFQDQLKMKNYSREGSQDFLVKMGKHIILIGELSVGGLCNAFH